MPQLEMNRVKLVLRTSASLKYLRTVIMYYDWWVKQSKVEFKVE